MEHRPQSTLPTYVQEPAPGTPMLRYHGHMDHEVDVRVLDLVDTMARADERLRPVRRWLTMVILELLDNSRRHALDREVWLQWTISRDRMTLCVGNTASGEHARRLRHISDRIAKTPAEDLRTAYLAQLEHGEMSPGGGAGLGMLKIARKTAGGLRITVTPTGEDRFLCTSTVCTALGQSARAGMYAA